MYIGIYVVICIVINVGLYIVNYLVFDHEDCLVMSVVLCIVIYIAIYLVIYIGLYIDMNGVMCIVLYSATFIVVCIVFILLITI